MAVDYFRSEFCRLLFRSGGADAAARHAWLNALYDAAWSQQKDGKTLFSTSYSGVFTQFQVLSGWKPDAIINLVGEARAWADAADVTAALALIAPMRRASVGSFSGATL